MSLLILIIFIILIFTVYLLVKECIQNKNKKEDVPFNMQGIYADKSFDTYRNSYDITNPFAWILIYDTEKEKASPNKDLLNILEKLIRDDYSNHPEMSFEEMCDSLRDNEHIITFW